MNTIFNTQSFDINANVIYTKCLQQHLGDCIMCCILFDNIKTYIEQNNIIIYFYIDEENLKQTKEFGSKNIIMLPSSEISNNNTIYDLWIGSPDYEFNFFSGSEMQKSSFYCKFYNQFLKKINIPIEINTFIYEDNDLLIRLENINKKTNNKYNNIDFLIQNGEPRSNQFNYNLEEWNNFITLLSQRYNVVTTQKVDGVKCTRDDNLTAKDIAAISTNNIKTIIAIDSGPTCGFYNKYTLKNTSVFYFLANDTFQSFSLDMIKKTKITDLFFLLDENKIEGFLSNRIFEIDKLNILFSSIALGLLLVIIFKYKKLNKYCKNT